MTQQAFDGGLTGGSIKGFLGTGYIEDDVIWNRGNLDLNGIYRVKILSIVPETATNFFSTRIRVGGEDFGAGAIVTNKNVGIASIRLYKTSPVPESQFEVDPTYSSCQIDRAVFAYDLNGTQITRYAESALSGYYDWITVPTAPTIGTPTVSGATVTVTYNNSSSTGVVRLLGIGCSIRQMMGPHGPPPLL